MLCWNVFFGGVHGPFGRADATRFWFNTGVFAGGVVQLSFVCLVESRYAFLSTVEWFASLPVSLVDFLAGAPSLKGHELLVCVVSSLAHWFVRFALMRWVGLVSVILTVVVSVKEASVFLVRLLLSLLLIV